MAVEIAMNVNGTELTETVEERTLLVDFLRDRLRLTGTHIGCDTAQCGACTIHMDGAAVKACNLLALQADGKKLITIEGIGSSESMHPMQKAFRDNHGLQCGYCTPGMIMSALDLIERVPDPNADQIREELDGNLCRCTGYHNIIESVQAGAKAMKS